MNNKTNGCNLKFEFSLFFFDHSGFLMARDSGNLPHHKRDIFTAHKRSLGQVNMFTGVSLSTGGVPAPGGVWSRGCLVGGGGDWSQRVWSQGVPG